MGIAHRRMVRGVTGLGFVAVAALTGCQSYPAGAGGMTLPSPHYLKHYPQYQPPSPPFPLQRELDSMQGPDLVKPAGVGPAPAPLPAPAGLLPPAPMPGGVPPAGLPK